MLRVIRLMYYYRLGEKLAKGKRSRHLSEEMTVAARNIYRIFAPRGIWQFNNTKHVTIRDFRRLRKADVKAARRVAKQANVSSDEEVTGESGGVLTSFPPQP